MNKRGVSANIVTILLVSLATLAIGIVWGVINNMIALQEESVSLGRITVNVEILNVEVNELENEVSVLVGRKAGVGNLIGFKFVLRNETYIELLEESIHLEELEEKIFILNPEMNVSDITIVNLAPLIRNEDQILLGNIQTYYLEK